MAESWRNWELDLAIQDTITQNAAAPDKCQRLVVSILKYLPAELQLLALRKAIFQALTHSHISIEGSQASGREIASAGGSPG